ncbi:MULTISPECIES: tail assembly protein [Pseudomonas]|uniref:tail assembly protein n=1 Tax=Pseudomonas TaxID=286 RepID=UPI0005A8C95A|nr:MULTISPECIES: tail assembly protein [Pseudomonas]KAB0532831.1 tail assembly protein [Pseudomonas chlororaphis subsp. aureofaciens]TSD25981.1 tail assembly protein [Pseudomonas sp. ATCC 13985]WDG57803.1 tail assembly protein [Pseudomonas chlororaphis]WDG64016.1 tail assembly protein [Pseudomonas chlororaphis]
MSITAAHYAPRTEIKLLGRMWRGLEKVHYRALDNGTAVEVFKALEVTVSGFKEEVVRLSNLGMRFAIFRNGKNVGEKEFSLSGTRELKIVPVIAGSKRAGLLQTVIGAVMIVAGVVISGMSFGAASPIGGALIAGGIGTVAGGVIQMLSPQQGGLSQSASPENLPSYAFGSAKNTTASGNPVPICIGERRWGGMIISASIYAEDKT